jgi:hypothetical protein
MSIIGSDYMDRRILGRLTYDKGWEYIYIYIYFFILMPCIIDYVEINQLNAPNYILLYFPFALVPTCFGKTMPSSGSDYVHF